MQYLVAVDPGVRFCGVAYFRDGVLRAAEYRSSTEPLRAAIEGTYTAGGASAGEVQCICERPQIVRGTRWGAARPQDILDLTLAAGRMTGALPTKYVYPAQWKGQLPKEVQHARMMQTLSTEEKAVLGGVQVRKSLLHNVYDAVSLGLVTLGRM